MGPVKGLSLPSMVIISFAAYGALRRCGSSGRSYGCPVKGLSLPSMVILSFAAYGALRHLKVAD